MAGTLLPAGSAVAEDPRGGRANSAKPERRFAGEAGEAVPGRYLVRFRKGSNSRAAVKTLPTGVEVLDVFEHAVEAATVKVPAAAVKGLRRNPLVLSVEPDRLVRIEGDSPAEAEQETASAAAVQSPAPWGLDRTDQRSLPLGNSYTYPSVGTGVKAYIVDTGIYGEHTQFGTRVLGGYDGVWDGWGTDDCDGHGTHVAGTVGGSVSGMAKGVSLVPVRVLDCYGEGYLSDIVGGLNWVVSNHVAGTPAVANLSLGSEISSTVDAATQGVIDDGVVVVAAAGNDADDACWYSPARLGSAITVGSTTSGDLRSPFSNYGSCLDLFAPGSSIVSADTWDPYGTVIMSGTSMAAPHAAGAAAVLLGQQPGLTPAQVADSLISNATTAVVADAGWSSPNRLLYSPPSGSTAPPLPSAPPNDAFANATSISLTGASSLSGSNVGATKETGEPSHAQTGGKSVWWKFTAPAAGTVTLSTRNSGFDTLLGVYTGSSVESLTSIAANDDYGSGTWSRVQFSAQANTTYRVAVDGYAGESGEISLASSWAAPPKSALSKPAGRWSLGSAVAVAWSATSSVGVSSFTVQRRSGGANAGLGAYANWLSPTALRSKSFTPSRGATYCFRTRATDIAGTTGAYTAARCTAVPLRANQLRYGSGWITRSQAGSYSGTVYRAARKGATASLDNVVGKHISVVATKCRDCGALNVYWRGSLQKTIRLSAATTRHKQVVSLLSFSGIKTGRLVLRTTSNKPVIIDGLGVSKG